MGYLVVYLVVIAKDFYFNDHVVSVFAACFVIEIGNWWSDDGILWNATSFILENAEAWDQSKIMSLQYI